MRVKNEYITFVYSEIKENEDSRVAKKIGKKFICGTVSNSSSRQKYTDIVKGEDELAMMCRHYPDTKVVTKGYSKDILYTPAKLIIPTLNNN